MTMTAPELNPQPETEITIRPRPLTFRVMGLEGDIKHEWDASRPAEVEIAREMFTKLVGEKKMTAWRTMASGEREQVRTFDPSDEALLFTPQMQGG